MEKKKKYTFDVVHLYLDSMHRYTGSSSFPLSISSLCSLMYITVYTHSRLLSGKETVNSKQRQLLGIAFFGENLDNDEEVFDADSDVLCTIVTEIS